MFVVNASNNHFFVILALITRFHRAKCREEEAAGHEDHVDGADQSSDIEGGEFL